MSMWPLRMDGLILNIEKNRFSVFLKIARRITLWIENAHNYIYYIYILSSRATL